MKIAQGDYSEVSDIRIRAKPGAAIGQCMREALLVAVQEWVDVVLTHNDKEYRVKVNALLGMVREEKGK